MVNGLQVLGNVEVFILEKMLKVHLHMLFERYLVFTELLIYIMTFFHFFFFQEITLAENSRVLDGWINPPPPVYMQYFFFNVTNPEEFVAGKAKPHVTQMGPYTYR